MNLDWVSSVFIIASLQPFIYSIDALPCFSHHSTRVASSHALDKELRRLSYASLSNRRPVYDRAILCLRNKKQTDETITDSSRRLAIFQLTTMVSNTLIGSNKAAAEDEFEIFQEKSYEKDEFLFDKREEDTGIGFIPTAFLSSNSTDLTANDPWEKFTPRVLSLDNESALAQAFAENDNPKATLRHASRVKSATKTRSSSSTKKASPQLTDEELSTDHMDAGSLFALSFPLMVLAGAALSFEKEKSAIANANDPQHTATGTPKVKIVMVEDQPYGLDEGRRYYNGIVVREYCDASKPLVTHECAQSIVGYLQDVSCDASVGHESEETASAIISYLDSLSVGGSSQIKDDHTAPQATGVAFSSYLKGLSEGSISAPSSAESVTLYLDSLVSKERERVSTLEARVNELESSLDDKVARELNKIATFLVDRAGIARDVYSRFEGSGSEVNTTRVNDQGMNLYQPNRSVEHSVGIEYVTNTQEAQRPWL